MIDAIIRGLDAAKATIAQEPDEHFRGFMMIGLRYAAVEIAAAIPAGEGLRIALWLQAANTSETK